MELMLEPWFVVWTVPVPPKSSSMSSRRLSHSDSLNGESRTLVTLIVVMFMLYVTEKMPEFSEILHTSNDATFNRPFKMDTEPPVWSSSQDNCNVTDQPAITPVLNISLRSGHHASLNSQPATQHRQLTSALLTSPSTKITRVCWTWQANGRHLQ